MAKKKVKSPKQKGKKTRQASIATNANGFLPLIVALVVSCCLFLPALQYNFVNWDDPINILDNPNLVTFDWNSIKGIFSSTVIGNYNPLTILTFAIEKAIFGLNPLVFHLNNILLHLLCIYFVYRIAIALNLSPMAAGLVALLFGIHPMRVESVTWITERKDVLFGAFYLAAVYQYILALEDKNGGKKRLGLIIGLFLLSLLSKIQAVALPLSFLAIDYLKNRPLSWKLIWEKTPYFILSLLIGLIGIFFLAEEGSLEEIPVFTFVDRLFIGGYSYLVYLIKFIFPYEMSPLYPYPATLGWYFYAGTAVSIAIIMALVYAFKKGYRILVFAFAFFTFNVMFMLQIIGAGQGFLADRFTYIPYLGLFLGLGFVFQHFSNTSKDTMVKAIAGLALVVFMGLTWQQNKIWKNGETLWTHVIGAYEEAVTPWGNRANYYQSIKAYDQAIADYEAAIGIDPESNNLYSSLGKVYFDKGDVQNALKNYNKGLALPKPFGELYINRGAAYASLGQYDAALADINNGLALDEDNANGYLNRGLIHYQKKNLKNTISDLNRYFTYKPGTSEEWFILGLSYRNTDDAASAITAYNRAIQLKPTDKRYYNSRANAYRALGKNAEAAQDEAKARQL